MLCNGGVQDGGERAILHDGDALNGKMPYRVEYLAGVRPRILAVRVAPVTQGDAHSGHHRAQAPSRHRRSPASAPVQLRCDGWLRLPRRGARLWKLTNRIEFSYPPRTSSVSAGLLDVVIEAGIAGAGISRRAARAVLISSTADQLLHSSR